MGFILGQFNRVDRDGDTMEGDLDFDTFKAIFGGSSIEGTASLLNFNVGAGIVRIQSNALRIGSGGDFTFLDTTDLAFFGTSLDQRRIQWASGTIPAKLEYDRATSKYEFTAADGVGGQTSIMFLSDNLLDLSGVSTDSRILVKDHLLIAVRDDPFTLENAPLEIRQDRLNLGGMLGDPILGIVPGTRLKINDGTNDLVSFSDNLLDLSGGTGPSEIKLKMYAQDTQPTLDSDGKVALWNKTDDNKLFFLARNNSTTKIVELT